MSDHTDLDLLDQELLDSYVNMLASISRMPDHTDGDSSADHTIDLSALRRDSIPNSRKSDRSIAGQSKTSSRVDNTNQSTAPSHQGNVTLSEVMDGIHEHDQSSTVGNQNIIQRRPFPMSLASILNDNDVDMEDATASGNDTAGVGSGSDAPQDIADPPQQWHSQRLACPFRKQSVDSCVHLGFTSLGNMKKHIRQKHEGSIRCPRCYRKFESRPRLLLHLREPETKICPVRRRRDVVVTTYDPTN